MYTYGIIKMIAEDQVVPAVNTTNMPKHQPISVLQPSLVSQKQSSKVAIGLHNLYQNHEAG